MPDEIKKLQNELVSIYQADKDCGAVPEDSEIIAAYEAAIEALKDRLEAEECQATQKAISKSYEPEYEYIRSYSAFCCCPNCGSTIAVRNKCSKKPKFCLFCGAPLDWSEVEE